MPHEERPSFLPGDRQAARMARYGFTVSRSVPQPSKHHPNLPVRGKLADADRVRAAAQGAASQRIVLSRLGLSADKKNVRLLATVCAHHRIELPDRAVNETHSPLDDPVLLADAAAHATTTQEAVQRCGLSSNGKTNRRFEQRCSEHGIVLPWKLKVGDGSVAQLNALDPKALDAAMDELASNGAVLDRFGIRKDGNAYGWMKRRRAARENAT